MSRGTGLKGTLPGVTSAADLSGKAGCFAKMVTATTVTYAAADTDKIIGIIVDGGTASGDPVSIDTRLGVVVDMVVDGNAGPISVGSWLTSDSAGKGVATTSDKKVIGAIALEGSTAAGDVIRVRTVSFTSSI